MQSKREKLQEQIEENPIPKNFLLKRLKHISWWGWSTEIGLTPSGKKI